MLAPLKLSSGVAVGTLCIIDSHPRRLDDEERYHLSQARTTGLGTDRGTPSVLE